MRHAAQMLRCFSGETNTEMGHKGRKSTRLPAMDPVVHFFFLKHSLMQTSSFKDPPSLVSRDVISPPAPNRIPYNTLQPFLNSKRIPPETKCDKNAFSFVTTRESTTPVDDASKRNIEGVLSMPHCPAMPVKTDADSVLYQ